MSLHKDPMLDYLHMYIRSSLIPQAVGPKHIYCGDNLDLPFCILLRTIYFHPYHRLLLLQLHPLESRVLLLRIFETRGRSRGGFGTAWIFRQARLLCLGNAGAISLSKPLKHNFDIFLRTTHDPSMVQELNEFQSAST